MSHLREKLQGECNPNKHHGKQLGAQTQITNP